MSQKTMYKFLTCEFHQTNNLDKLYTDEYENIYKERQTIFFDAAFVNRISCRICDEFL